MIPHCVTDKIIDVIAIITLIFCIIALVMLVKMRNVKDVARYRYITISIALIEMILLIISNSFITEEKATIFFTMIVNLCKYSGYYY
jgi:uncharacterized protein YebE (UPF0316 family)